MSPYHCIHRECPWLQWLDNTVPLYEVYTSWHARRAERAALLAAAQQQAQGKVRRAGPLWPAGPPCLTPLQLFVVGVGDLQAARPLFVPGLANPPSSSLACHPRCQLPTTFCASSSAERAQHAHRAQQAAEANGCLLCCPDPGSQGRPSTALCLPFWQLPLAAKCAPCSVCKAVPSEPEWLSSLGTMQDTHHMSPPHVSPAHARPIAGRRGGPRLPPRTVASCGATAGVPLPGCCSTALHAG